MVYIIKFVLIFMWWLTKIFESVNSSEVLAFRQKYNELFKTLINKNILQESDIDLMAESGFESSVILDILYKWYKNRATGSRIIKKENQK